MSGSKLDLAGQSPTSFAALCSAVRTKCETCLAQAEGYFNLELSRPEVRFDLRGRAAGQYRSSRMRSGSAELRFNRVLLEQNPDSFLAEVVPHEVAHLVAYAVFGRRIKPHGREWRSIMSEIYRLEPSVTHSFDVPESGRLKHPYQCACEGRVHRLSSIRHNRISRGTSQYLCRDCKQTLMKRA